MVQVKQSGVGSGRKSQDNAKGTKAINYTSPQSGNIEAEALLLGALLKDVKHFYTYGPYLDESDFTDKLHGIIFLCLKSLCEDGSSPKITPLKIIAQGNKLGFADIGELTDNGNVVEEFIRQPIVDGEIKNYFLIVKRRTIVRTYDNELVNIKHYLNTTDDDINNIISTIENQILGKSQIIDHGDHALKEFAKDGREIIESLADNPGRLGLDVGMSVWQKHIGELRNGSVHIIIAGPKARKSTFGLQSAVYLASKFNIPVLVCDSELNQRDQTVRSFGIFYQIPFWILETGYWKLADDVLVTKDITKFQLEQIKDARRKLGDTDLAKRYAEMPITYLNINGLSVMDAIPIMRQWIFQKTKINSDDKFPQAFIVYDYLKLSTDSELRRTGGVNIQEYQSLGLNCSALHDFAQKHSIPILTFGQTNRDFDDSINCIAGSKRLVELTDSCSLLKEKKGDLKNKFPNGNFLFRVFCARYGISTNEGHIDFEFSETGNVKEIGFNDGSQEDDTRRGRKNQNSGDDEDAEDP